MKILTWNSQGYHFGEVNSLVNKLKPDIVTLQECGNIRNVSIIEMERKEGIHPFYQGVWKCGKELYNIFYYGWRNDSRCSMATLVKMDLSFRNPNCLLAINVESERRKYKAEPTEKEDIIDRQGIRATIRLHVNDLYVCNVHLPSGCPEFARKIGHTYLNFSKYLSSNMIMIGDFNTVPNSWSLDKNLRIINSGESTHEKNELDYAITNSTKNIYIEVKESAFSDHRPVLLTLEE